MRGTIHTFPQTVPRRQCHGDDHLLWWRYNSLRKSVVHQWATPHRIWFPLISGNHSSPVEIFHLQIYYRNLKENLFLSSLKWNVISCSSPQNLFWPWLRNLEHVCFDLFSLFLKFLSHLSVRYQNLKGKKKIGKGRRGGKDTRRTSGSDQL